ncbi:MAG: hypothetical protein QM687_09910 [Ferruginibacter sp.]
MAIDNLTVVDAISIDLNGNAVLTISDHLEWCPDNEHILMLQNKINAYLAFIESGQLYKKYPNATNRKIVIQLVTKYIPNKEGSTFFNKVKETLPASDYSFINSTLNSIQ